MSRVVTSHPLPTYAQVDLAFERDRRPRPITTDGERYLDLTDGGVVNGLGHAHLQLVAALVEKSLAVAAGDNVVRSLPRLTVEEQPPPPRVEEGREGEKATRVES